jgi:hypothetical protein
VRKHTFHIIRTISITTVIITITTVTITLTMVDLRDAARQMAPSSGAIFLPIEPLPAGISQGCQSKEGRLRTGGGHHHRVFQSNQRSPRSGPGAPSIDLPDIALEHFSARFPHPAG